ncbi:regulatory protein, FmdB family [Thioalkalivibrio nitratireducens DSM 14787]|uniref:Regulatory protein, FmdB family n=1 Tax=Thioalkalivibrio nitratireducens (strain DSM 14787 / UNIQEM 213 / ALEN2) TaxID=1255043 RepID=L0E143_THIND|nr:zinc ribbon domain-containing protein [Thioalkalivibrio nitratireducens]AGA35018.1 regulatory protein, FmdB family [Thioalkalivibrio nitratireducens DSM 14787]
MPIYEYECSACGDRTEVIQKLSDPVLTDCPACGTSALNKLVSAAGFRLSGGGWYETDFKKDKRRNLKEDATRTDSGPAGGCGAPACGSGSCAAPPA